MPAPTGAIAVEIGPRTVDRQLADGRARLVVRGLKPGTKQLVVRYAGTDPVRAGVLRSEVRVLPDRH